MNLICAVKGCYEAGYPSLAVTVYNGFALCEACLIRARQEGSKNPMFSLMHPADMLYTLEEEVNGY